MSIQKTHVFVIVFLLIAIISCQTDTQVSLSDSDKAAINKTIDDALALANATEKDWVAYVKAYYALDAVILPPNASAAKGHEAIVSYLASFPPLSDIKYEQVEMDGIGSLAYVWGTYSLDMLPTGAETPINDSGKYIEIWRKQEDGSWRITLDIFNSDLPLP